MKKNPPLKSFFINVGLAVIVLGAAKAYSVWAGGDSLEVSAGQAGIVAAAFAGMLTRLWVDIRKAKHG